MDAYEAMFAAGGAGFGLIALLYYANQVAKRAGYISPRLVPAAVAVESAAMVMLYAWARSIFYGVAAALALAVAVLMYHASIQAKAKDGQ